MSLVLIGDVTQFLGEPDVDDTTLIETLTDAAEQYASQYCRRTFESTSYSLERYDGGSQYVMLKNYPVTAVTRVSVGSFQVVSVTNTADYTTASVSVSPTGVILEKDGTTASTIAFATYTTMSTLSAAINALGNSWLSAVVSSTYSSYKTSSIIPQYGQNAIDSNYVYLYVPNAAESEIDVDIDRGMVYLSSGFSPGKRNVYVSYVAGYSSSTMPEDLKLAIKLTVKNLYKKWTEEAWSLQSYRVGDISYTQMTPVGRAAATNIFGTEGLAILNRYRRSLI
jgi:hypothetical protein